LVTGASGGLGSAVAKALAAQGAKLALSGSNIDKLEAFRAELGGDHVAVPCNLSDPAAVDALIPQAVEALGGKLDILVNNAGIYGPRDFYELSDEDWTRIFDVNVMSGVRLARAYTAAMAQSGWGRVVFISSESALNTPEDMIHYGFSKTAQLAVSRGLAKRLSGTGVTVNAVLPGPTLSDGLR
ncbi:SDR family NAD(P)-dependent oxidoreductase, partial [Staphylococcus aureus]|nr:SDR family NAD(P)-dependent oxidoreductase [Staphylococcus aureus]